MKNLLSRRAIYLFTYFFFINFLLAGSTIAADKIIKWRCQTSIPISSVAYTDSVKFAIEKIKEATNGRLLIEPLPAGSILPNDQIFSGVKRGMIEVGYAVPYYWPSDIPLARLCQLPGAFSKVWEVLYFYKQLGFEDALRSQIKSHGVLYWTDHVLPTEIVSTKPITSLADLKNIKIRTYGNNAKYLSKLGAATTYVPGPEIYTGMATGVFDAATWGASIGASSLALYEQAKYHILPSTALGTDEGWFINAKAFAKLPKDIQDIVSKVLDDQLYVKSIQNAYAEQANLGSVMKKYGVKVNYIVPEDQKEMARVAATIWDDIVEKDKDNETREYIDILKVFLKELGRM